MASKERNAEYKPLLFTTTVRNPERIKYNLFVLKKFENQILTNELATAVVGELIKYGLYRPMKVSANVKTIWKQTSGGEFAVSLLDDKTVLKIIKKIHKNTKKQASTGDILQDLQQFLTLQKNLVLFISKLAQKSNSQNLVIS